MAKRLLLKGEKLYRNMFHEKCEAPYSICTAKEKAYVLAKLKEHFRLNGESNVGTTIENCMIMWYEIYSWKHDSEYFIHSNKNNYFTKNFGWSESKFKRTYKVLEDCKVIQGNIFRLDTRLDDTNYQQEIDALMDVRDEDFC